MHELEHWIEQARARRATVAERHEAFALIVKEFEQMALALASRILNDAVLAEDAAQEAFVMAYQNLHQLREPKAFPGWFKRLVISQSNRLVRRKQVAVHAIELAAASGNPALAAEQSDLRARVMRAIHALPQHEREVTKLFYINGYSQNEIAKLLELPVTTVKKRLQYARQRLRGIMVTMFDTLAPEPVPAPIPVQRRLPSPPPADSFS